MKFPQYRKIANGKSVYKITGFDQFTELQRIGTRNVLYQIKAKTYFEKVRIQEMLNLVDPYLMANPEEIETLINT